jgi:translation initiation factor IF-3
MDKKPAFEGRSLTMFLSPKPVDKQKKPKDNEEK